MAAHASTLPVYLLYGHARVDQASVLSAEWANLSEDRLEDKYFWMQRKMSPRIEIIAHSSEETIENVRRVSFGALCTLRECELPGAPIRNEKHGEHIKCIRSTYMRCAG